MFGLWSYLVVFALIAILLVILWIVYAPDSPWAPWWKTNKKIARAAAKLAKIGPNDVVYELGSGDGEFIVTVAQDFHPRKAVGVEIDLLRDWMARVRLFLNPKAQKNAQFVRRNFYDVNLKGVTVVYFYLVPNAIKRLLPKLKKELKPGTRLVSYYFKIAGMEPVAVDKKNKIYLYKI